MTGGSDCCGERHPVARLIARKRLRRFPKCWDETRPHDEGFHQWLR